MKTLSNIRLLYIITAGLLLTMGCSKDDEGTKKDDKKTQDPTVTVTTKPAANSNNEIKARSSQVITFNVTANTPRGFAKISITNGKHTSTVTRKDMSLGEDAKKATYPFPTKFTGPPGAKGKITITVEDKTGAKAEKKFTVILI